MINIEEFDPGEQKYEMALEFNKLYQRYREQMTQFSYYDLYNKQENSRFSLLDWKEFYLDKRVQKWYSQELELALDNKLQTLLSEAGENHSTATNQTLNNILRYKKDNEITQDSNKYFIYGHIPLTETEEHLENVKTIENVPKEISDAITVLDGNEKD